VIGSLLASLALSFTMVPVLFRQLMSRAVHEFAGEPAQVPPRARSSNPLVRFQAGFERAFENFRESYRNTLAWALSQARLTVIAFVVLIVVSVLLFPLLGRDFFPQVDAGQMRLHVRAPPGTRLEKTQQYFAEVEAQIRKLVGRDQIDVMLDNIGLPYSGINIALSDSATVGPMDGEILISLNKKHAPTAKLIAMLRRELPARFAELQFFFQPADIVDQVLNFGQPAPIDVRVSGPDQDVAFSLAAKIARALTRVPGVVDSHVFQVPNAPALTVNMDRALATEAGVTQQEAANNVLVGRSAKQRELSARRSSSDLPHRLFAGSADDAGDFGSGDDVGATAAESRVLRPRSGSDGDLAAQHTAGFRRPCRCPRPRSVFDGARH
jgi:multidrug efflux pump subunit AcrB